MGTIEKSPAFSETPTGPSDTTRTLRIEIPPVLVNRIGRSNVELRAGVQTWLVDFARETMQEVEILLENAADNAAHIRVSMLLKLLGREKKWSDEEVTVEEAANLTGVCEETIRRKTRDGSLASSRNGERGHLHIRRGDLAAVEQKRRRAYDGVADAHDIVKQKRQAS